MQRILLLVYDGFETLELSGASSVFANANTQKRESVYEIKVISSKGAGVRSSAGLITLTERLDEISPRPTDTILVMGGEEEAVQREMENPELTSWLQSASQQVFRYGSVCAGAFILAEAGLLNQRRVATHWAACHQLSRRYPTVSVEADALYVQDGSLWTSAGVSTGIDMTLAMVEQDLGSALMGKVAQYLVVYAHRPGNQSQFSTVLDAQVSAGETFPEVIAWIAANLHHPIQVEDMAQQAGMSERNFYRKFNTLFDITPSKYLERLRLERAKQLLARKMPIKTVVLEVGFRSEAGFRSAFERCYGISPSAYQLIHSP